jgi:hypothetical protein
LENKGHIREHSPSFNTGVLAFCSSSSNMNRTDFFVDSVSRYSLTIGVAAEGSTVGLRSLVTISLRLMYSRL